MCDHEAPVNMHVYFFDIYLYIYIFFFQPKLIRNFSRRLSNRLIRLFGEKARPKYCAASRASSCGGLSFQQLPKKTETQLLLSLRLRSSCCFFGVTPKKKEQNWGGGNKFPSPARFHAIPRDDVTTGGDGGGDEALVSWSPVRGGHTVHGERQESK